jgi:DNA-binding CsgD family transcriptional regulator
VGFWSCGVADRVLELTGMADHRPFDRGVAEILRDADRTMRLMRPLDHRRLYNLWRVTMGAVTPVDSFYVGFIRDDRMLVVPYVFDGVECDPPGIQVLGYDGLSAWVRKHAVPYTYAQDDGRLLNKGHSFGDTSRRSLDAIVIPLFAESAVIGLAAVLTYQANVYNDETARIFQWLARTVTTVLDRDREDLTNRAILAFDGPPDTDTPVSVPEFVADFSRRLESIRLELDDIIAELPDDSTRSQARLCALRASCERAQTETVQSLLASPTENAMILDRLTRREREIAELIAEGMSNTQIAEQLTISEPTVKTHVTRVLKKFGVRQRAAVAAKLRPFG